MRGERFFFCMVIKQKLVSRNQVNYSLIKSLERYNTDILRHAGLGPFLTVTVYRHHVMTCQESAIDSMYVLKLNTRKAKEV